MTISNEMTPIVPRLREHRSTIASFAALICGVMIFLWVSRGTQLHKLAIGIAMSAITLSVALALFELCWRVGLVVAGLFGSENRN
jgi:ABC-type proline/glycine betaine transport system permease subunit